MKTTITTLLLATAVPAWAQVTPGLWETDWKTTVNGQDLGALMKRAMVDALQRMPADQRAQAEAMLKQQEAAFGGKAQECLTPEEAARLAKPEQVLADLQQGAPQCQFEAVKTHGGLVSFKGRCDDPDGFRGDIAGEFRLEGAKAWTSRWGGTGRVNGLEALPGLAPAADGRVDYRATGSGRWLAASCGTVKPR